MVPSWTWASLFGPYRLGHLGRLQSLRLGKLSLLATLESASIISTDNSRKLALTTDSAITVRGNLTGPLSSETHDGAIHLVNVRNGERFKDPRFDENDQGGPLITSMDSRPSGEGKSVLGRRQVERLNECTGSLYILPIAQMPIPICHAYSLILYQPLGETLIFYRVGYLTSINASDTQRFYHRDTVTSVVGTLITIL
ncbi:hypothetical protein FSHL1_002995 [Fusarium sambucinum]